MGRGTPVTQAYALKGKSRKMEIQLKRSRKFNQYFMCVCNEGFKLYENPFAIYLKISHNGFNELHNSSENTF